MAEIQGLGHSRKRVEDARFIRGRGDYIDDLKVPGMIYLDIVRSPLARAKIKSINSEKALEVPGVLAVVRVNAPFQLEISSPAHLRRASPTMRS